MFSFGGGLGMLPLSLDLSQERSPPPPPTRLDFPDYPPTDFSNQPCTESGCHTLQQLLSKLKKPQDVSEEFLQALNLKIETDVKLSEIVPGGKLSSLPPFRWPETPGKESTPGPPVSSGKGGLSNGYAFPSKDKYDLIRQEILLENEDAFRAVARMEPRPGRPNTRVTHSRNMWTGLDNIAQYWDSSEDKYFEKEFEESPTTKDDNNNPEKMNIDAPANDRSSSDSSSEDKMDIDETTTSSETENEAEGPKRMRKKEVYMGRRIGAGSQTPEHIRDDAVRGFVEMVGWSFGCQTHVPTQAPRLMVKSLLFPVRHTFTMCRIPRDRQEAKRGLLEGPVLLAQCRGETAFHEDEDGQDCRYAAMCDLLRETSGMLLLAQERAREGLAEVKPGEGKWWATEPRWGGAPNEGPVGEAENGNGKENEKETRGAASEADHTSSKRSRHSRRAHSQRKLSMAERWKLVQPGPSLWDRRLKYSRVGMERDDAFDNIFMVSSLNHHFSILHLRVHPRYLAWLVTGSGEIPDTDKDDSKSPEWQSLVLRRTRWYDLLDPADRVEGLDGLWALFAWLMR